MMDEFGAWVIFAFFIFVFVLIVAAILLPLFVWGIYNRAVEIHQIAKRMEKGFDVLLKNMDQDGANIDGVARNIDANLAQVSTAILRELERRAR